MQLNLRTMDRTAVERSAGSVSAAPAAAAGAQAAMEVSDLAE